MRIVMIGQAVAAGLLLVLAGFAGCWDRGRTLRGGVSMAAPTQQEARHVEGDLGGRGDVVGRVGRRGPGLAGAAPPPTVEAVSRLSELTTVRVVLADVSSSRVDGLTGGPEADVLVRGEFTVATDVAAARFESVDPRRRTAVLVCPPPRASPVRIDHAHSRVVLVRQTGAWAVLPGDDARVAVVDLAYRDAERLLSGAGRDDRQYRDLARRRAEEVLRAFLGRTGWSVQVRWE